MSQFNAADLLITISSQWPPNTAANGDGVRDIQHILTFPHIGGPYTCDTQFSAGMRSTVGREYGKSIALPTTRDGDMAAYHLLLPNPEKWVEAVPAPDQWETEGSAPSYTIRASLNTGISAGPNIIQPVYTFLETVVDGPTLGKEMDTICTWTPGVMSRRGLPKGLEGWVSDYVSPADTIGSTGMDMHEQLRNQLIADSVSLESACKALATEAKSGKK